VTAPPASMPHRALAGGSTAKSPSASSPEPEPAARGIKARFGSGASGRETNSALTSAEPATFGSAPTAAPTTASGALAKHTPTAARRRTPRVPESEPRRRLLLQGRVNWNSERLGKHGFSVGRRDAADRPSVPEKLTKNKAT